jgi:hypothetical protein
MRPYLLQRTGWRGTDQLPAGRRGMGLGILA